MTDKVDISKLINLARISLSNENKNKFEAQLSEVLEAFEKIDELDLKCEPAFQPIEIENIMRDDIIEKSLSQEDSLKNSVHKKDKFFKGPKIFD